MTAFQSLLSTISYHRYPLTHCGGRNITLEELMADAATKGEAEFFKPLVEDATALGLRFYIGEGNSVSCGGMPGVSNVYGVVLWAVDFLFSLASVNVRGINFHGGASAAYTAISYASVDEPVPGVRPLYYAMWLFSEVIKNDAKILEITTTTINPLIKVWAVVNTKGIVTIVAIHKDLAKPQAAEVAVTPSSTLTGAAQLSVLKSSTDVHAENGISYAGLTFDDSKDGLPLGIRKTTPLAPSSDGDYHFELEPMTVVVLELPSK